MSWQLGQLRHLTDVSVGEWIRPRLAPFGSGLTAIVPSGYDAYARVFHPVRTNDDAVTTWAAVAAESGNVAHAQMQWHVIETPATGHVSADQLSPDEGVLEELRLRALGAVLRRQSRHPENCFHALWNGHGGWSSGGWTMKLDPDGREGPWRPARCVLPPEVTGGPLLLLPDREYFVFAGPVVAALDFVVVERFEGGELVHRRSPQLIWPADQSWCVATEIDFDSTLVGGPQELIDDIAASPDLEALQITPAAALAWDGDTVNDPDGSLARAWYVREFGRDPRE